VLTILAEIRPHPNVFWLQNSTPLLSKTPNKAFAWLLYVQYFSDFPSEGGTRNNLIIPIKG
jgi:hypothetical protein